MLCRGVCGVNVHALFEGMSDGERAVEVIVVCLHGVLGQKRVAIPKGRIFVWMSYGIATHLHVLCIYKRG